MTTRRDFLRTATLASAASLAVPSAAESAAPAAAVGRRAPAGLPLPPVGPLDLVAIAGQPLVRGGAS